jgi:hypothetical protein
LMARKFSAERPAPTMLPTWTNGPSGPTAKQDAKEKLFGRGTDGGDAKGREKRDKQ